MIKRIARKIAQKRHKIKDYEALASLVLSFSFIKTFFYCKIFAYFGIISGFILSTGILFVTFYLTLFVLQLSDEYEEQNYKELYYRFIKPKLLINFTFQWEYLSCIVFSLDFTFYKIVYLLKNIGLISTENFQNNILNQDNTQITKIRYIFVIVLYLGFSFVFLYKDLGQIKTTIKIVFWFYIVYHIYLLLNAYSNINGESQSNGHIIWFKFPSILSLLKNTQFLSLNFIQSNILIIRNDLYSSQTISFYKKIKLSFSLILIDFILIGFFMYLMLGQEESLKFQFYTPTLYPIFNNLMIFVHAILIICFSSFFFIGFKNLKQVETKKQNFYYTIVPITILFLFYMLVPDFILNNVLKKIKICTLANNFIYPLLVKYKLLKEKQENKTMQYILLTIIITLIVIEVDGIFLRYLF